MKIYFYLFLSIHLGCFQITSKDKSSTELLGSENKPVVLENSYENFKNLFKEVKLPYQFNSDSIFGENYNLWAEDSILITKEMAVKWMFNTDKVKSKTAQFIFTDYIGIDRFYFKNRMFKLEPFRRINLIDNDILFVKTFSTITGMKDAEYTIWVLSYSKNGELLNSIELGKTNKGLCLPDMKMVDIDDYWIQKYFTSSINVDLKSLNNVQVTILDSMRTEYHRSRPYKKDYLITKSMGTKKFRISLLF